MQTIDLEVFGIIVTLEDGGGSIISDLHEPVPDEEDFDTDLYNASMDDIESVILAHAIAGVDIKSPAYKEGVEVAVQGCASNI